MMLESARGPQPQRPVFESWLQQQELACALGPVVILPVDVSSKCR